MDQNTDNHKSNKGLLLLLLLFLFSFTGVIWFYQSKVSRLGPQKPDEKQSMKLKRWESTTDSLKNILTEERKGILAELEEMPLDNDSRLLKEFMLAEIDNEIEAIGIITREVKKCCDTNQMSGIQARLENIISSSSRSLEANKFTSSIIVQFNEMDQLRGKIDSLNQYIVLLESKKANATVPSSVGQGMITELNRAKKERDDYKKELLELQATSLKLRLEKDSLSQAISMKDSIIDSLNKEVVSLTESNSKLLVDAQRNAQLATRVEVWYFEKDKMKRPQRRLLKNDKADYNKGTEIKTIHGFFSLSADLVKPFMVTDIKLVKDGESEPVSTAQMTVRNQNSGEFSLITDKGLQPGAYTVLVESEQKKLIEQVFYITK